VNDTSVRGSFLLILGISLVAGALGACSYIPFSGGALEGEVASPLADWRELDSAQIIQLETNSNDPYSVKLWIIGQHKHLYVFAGDSHAQWAQNIDSDPNVRLKVGGTIYELHATRVLDQEEFRRFADAWLEKYGSDRRDVLAVNNYLYRMTRRPTDS